MKYKPLINFFLLAIFLTFIYQNLFFIFFKDINNDVTRQLDKQSIFAASEQDNLFIISFDGVSGRLMNELIKHDAKFFENFTFFPNVISQGSHTQSSMIGEIYGSRNYKEYGETIDDMIMNLDKNPTLKNNLIHNSYQNHLIGNYYSDILKDKFDTVNFFEQYKIESSIKYYLDLLSIIQCKISFCIDRRMIISNLYHYIALKTNLVNYAVISNADLWQRIYDDFIKNLKSDKNIKNKIFTIHFNQTHSPPSLNEKCMTVGYKEFLKNYDGKGAQLNAKCTYNNIKKFILKLKEINIFDNSNILIKSDHGYSAEHFNKYPYNLGINGNINIGIDRFNPFILVKKKNNVNKKFEIISEQVLINDIAKSLCLLKNKEKNCEVYGGTNLFDFDKNFDESFFVYLPKNKNSNHDLKNSVEIEFNSRNINFKNWLIINNFIKVD